MGSGPERRFLVAGRLSEPVRGGLDDRYRLRCARLVTVRGSGEQRVHGAEGGQGDEKRARPGPALC